MPVMPKPIGKDIWADNRWMDEAEYEAFNQQQISQNQFMDGATLRREREVNTQANVAREKSARDPFARPQIPAPIQPDAPASPAPAPEPQAMPSYLPNAVQPPAPQPSAIPSPLPVSSAPHRKYNPYFGFAQMPSRIRFSGVSYQ